MSRYRWLIHVTAGMILTVTFASGITIYVDDDGPWDPGPGDSSISDPNEDGSTEHPFDTIQEAIDDADNGDIILIEDGVYSGPGNWNIDYTEKKITVTSTNGPTHCVIDGQGNSGDGVTLYNPDNIPPEMTLKGVTICGALGGSSAVI